MKEVGIVIEFLEKPARLNISLDAWRACSPVMQTEICRMVSELTAGIKKYQSASDRDSTLDEFHEMAVKSGKTLKDVIAKYVATEQLMRTHPIRGLIAICNNRGTTLEDVCREYLARESNLENEPTEKAS